MTLPIERKYAVKNALQFLYDLLDSKKTPRVPRKIREQARRVLKHYPHEFYLSRTDECFWCGKKEKEK